MGLFSRKKPHKPTFKLSKEGQKWQGRVDDQIEGAMDGRGMLPQQLQGQMYSNSLNAINQGFTDSTVDLESFIQRLVKPGDEKVADYLRMSNQNAKASAVDNLDIATKMQKGQDEQWGMDAALEEIGLQREYGNTMLNTYNRTLDWAKNVPGFWEAGLSAAGPGIGSMLGSIQTNQNSVATGQQIQPSNLGAGPMRPQAANTYMANYEQYGQAMSKGGFSPTVSNVNNWNNPMMQNPFTGYGSVGSLYRR